MVESSLTSSDAAAPPPRLSPRELASLKGIVDALLPSLAVPDDMPQSNGSDSKKQQQQQQDDDAAMIRDYWHYQVSSDPDFLQALEEIVLTKIHPTERFLMRLLLNILANPVGCAAVMGSFQPLWRRQAFGDLSQPDQTACLKNLQLSRFAEKRKVFMGLKRLICGLAFSFTPDQDRVPNPFWKAMGYDGPLHWKLTKQQDASRMSGDFRTMENVMISVEDEPELEVDVVIVGSGAGGSVAAAILAQTGYSVVVVEKGSYVAPHQVSQLEADAYDQMYEAHNLLTTADGNLVILAGSTLGGGTTVNWSCCIPLPDFVRQEWVTQHKLPQFEADGEFDVAQAAIMDRLGCADLSKVELNALNQVMQDGCDKLAYKWTKTRQNIRDNSKHAENGFICFGDRHDGNKQSMLVTYLQDAVQHGARIVENCNVQQIITGLYPASNGTQRRRAVGIVGMVDNKKLTIRARKCVIGAAGSLHTPCLLQKSWLQNPHIGRHLRLHPVFGVFSYFEEEKRIWYGSPMTTVCEEFADGPEKDGYGAKIEVPSSHTGLAAACLQFIDPVHYRRAMLDLKHLVALMILQRDSSEGRVCMSSDGVTPKVDYVVNVKDKHSMLEACKAAIRILIAGGAKRVGTSHSRDEGFVVPPPDDANRDEKINEYIEEIDARGVRELETGYFCAHQMGSCRMSASPSTGVVDSNGEVWECDDLYLFDTSIFPTASGANPMMTVLTLSHMLSTRLAKRLRHEDGQLSPDPKLNEAMGQLRQLRLKVSQAVPWTRTAKILFGITWSAVPLFMAWMFWNPGLIFTERIGVGGDEL